MRKIIYPVILGISVLTLSISCQKSSKSDTINPAALTQEETALIASAGFNSNWAEKRTDGNYLIEGDILLSRAQLQEMSGASPSNNFIVADEEHYRTYNLVNTGGGVRSISVSIDNSFPSIYSTALSNVLARYNSLNLNITFQWIASGGEIHITAANLGTSGGGCILGRSAGFPSNGNPAPGFTLSTNSCALGYMNTVDKVDEVMAHEIGHAIGFRHTDYKKRASCGPGPGEQAGSIGAVHIAGTPTNVPGSYNSWMMACVNGSPDFSATDVTALQVVY